MGVSVHPRSWGGSRAHRDTHGWRLSLFLPLISVIAQTAGTSDEDSTSTVAAEENTQQNSKVATKENLRDIGARVYGRGVSRLLASCAFVVLYLL